MGYAAVAVHTHDFCRLDDQHDQGGWAIARHAKDLDERLGLVVDFRLPHTAFDPSTGSQGNRCHC